MRAALEAVERRLDACEAGKVYSLVHLSPLSPLGPTRLVRKLRGAMASEGCNSTFALCQQRVAYHFHPFRVAWYAWPRAKVCTKSLN